MKHSKFCCLVMIMLTFFCCPSTMSEGLLPDLNDVYGIDVPSFIDVIDRNPDSVERMEQETVFFFSDISDEDYYAYGELLKEAGCSINNYSVYEDKIEVLISLEEKSFSFIYDIDNDTITFIYPAGVYDAVYHRLEIQFQSALQRVKEGRYDAAMGILEKMPDYEAMSFR